MKKILPFPANTATRKTAAEWLIRIDRGPLNHSDKTHLQTWLQQDPKHGQLLLKMAKMWGELEVVKVLADLFPLPENNEKTTISSSSCKSVLIRNPARATASVAAAVILAVAGLVAVQGASWWPSPVDTSARESVHQTVVGEHSIITLTDGSRMHLNTQSKARVSFDEAERAIYLEQGEGYFQVAKNKDLPFVVYAKEGMIRALGTEFNVRIQDDNVDVTLSKGEVEVLIISKNEKNKIRSSGSSMPENRHIAVTVLESKGERVNYRQSIEQLIHVPDDQLQRELAWKSGKWVFQGESLAQVMTEASRYTNTEIRIVDPLINDLQVAGYFDVGDLEPLLEAIETALPVKVSRLERGIIELSGTEEIH